MFSQAALVLLAVFCASEAALLKNFLVKDAAIEDFPYQLSLKKWALHACSATIFDEYWAITSAHCVLWAQPGDMSLQAGSSKLYFNFDEQYTIEKVIVHENFDPKTTDYAIALLKLAKPFEFSTKVNKIALAGENDSVAIGSLGTVSGWRTTAGHRFTEDLKAIQIPFVASHICSDFYGKSFQNTVCAGFSSGNDNSCQGDTGSPLVYNGKLFGVLAHSKDCAQMNEPGVYTDVAAFRQWIKEKSQV